MTVCKQESKSKQAYWKMLSSKEARKQASKGNIASKQESKNGSEQIAKACATKKIQKQARKLRECLELGNTVYTDKKVGQHGTVPLFARVNACLALPCRVVLADTLCESVLTRHSPSYTVFTLAGYYGTTRHCAARHGLIS